MFTLKFFYKSGVCFEKYFQNWFGVKLLCLMEFKTPIGGLVFIEKNSPNLLQRGPRVRVARGLGW